MVQEDNYRVARDKFGGQKGECWFTASMPVPAVLAVDCHSYISSGPGRLEQDSGRYSSIGVCWKEHDGRGALDDSFTAP